MIHLASRRVVVPVLALALWLAFAAVAAAAEPLGAQGGFERLKSMEGEWTATGGEMAPATFRYEVTAGGSAVIETLFAGTNHEMVSVYFVEGDTLALTHYCVLGNRPELALQSSDANSMTFGFKGGALDPAKDAHIHGGVIRFLEDGRVASEWTEFAEGKPAVTRKFVLARR